MMNRSSSTLSGSLFGSFVVLLAVAPFLFSPDPARAVNGSIFCACCTICPISERACPDNVSIMSGVRTQTASSTDRSCCNLCAGETCISGGATCQVAVQNMRKYTLSGSVSAKGFGLTAGWESQTVTTSTCTANPRPVACTCVSCRGGLVHTVKTGSGNEVCTGGGTCAYSGTLRELTGCYANSSSCICL